MSSRTKIVVLHMKEIIYTAIFAALALLVIVLLIFMFGTGKKDSAVKNEKQYTPGTYTSTLTYTSQLILDAVSEAVEKAAVK